MIGVGQPPEDAPGSAAAHAEVAGLAEHRARRDLPTELDRLQSRVEELEAMLEEERAERRVLRAQLEQTERTIADVRTGAMELALRLTAEQDARKVGPAPPPAARRTATFATRPAGSPAPEPTSDPEGATLIEGLQRAAERLRTRATEREPDEEAIIEVVGQDAEEVTAADAPPASDESADVRTAAVALPEIVLAPRRSVPAERTAWLAGALDRLVAADADRAAAALVALVPAQAARSRRPLAYDLAVVGSGTWRVRLSSAGGAVGPLLGGPAPDRDVAFVVSGPAGALVPLAAGGARRRLAGTLTTGRRRRLHRLLRDLRAPIVLPDLVEGGTEVDAVVLLDLLSGAVDPVWTGVHAFAVDYEVTGARATRVRVSVESGASAAQAPSNDAVHATVTVPGTALAALLAGLPLPGGAVATATGDPELVDLLHGWFDAAQALPA